MTGLKEVSVAREGALDVSLKEQRELTEAYAKLREAEAKLIGSDGKTEALPNNLYSFLLRLLADLRAGQAVTILQNRHELTTAEAAKILGLSRQFLVQLLEKEAIPFHMAGTHRRLYVRDVLVYKSKRDMERRKTLDNLARREFEEGVYDQVPDDFHAGR
jgi:excisionase family DNA binding protein